MKSFGVYVAAPFEDRAYIRDKVHPKLVERGWEPTSRWVQAKDGALDAETAAKAIAQNDMDVIRSSAMLVLPRPGTGAETFCELRFATLLNLPIVYVQNRDVLSMYRPRVAIVNSLDEALKVLGQIASHLNAKRYLDDLSDLAKATDQELSESLQHWRAKIDGPENDGRLTTGSSAALDYWGDNVEAIEKEIAKRKESSALLDNEDTET